MAFLLGQRRQRLSWLTGVASVEVQCLLLRLIFRLVSFTVLLRDWMLACVTLLSSHLAPWPLALFVDYDSV